MASRSEESEQLIARAVDVIARSEAILDRGRPNGLGLMAHDQPTAHRLKAIAKELADSGEPFLLLDALRCLADDRSDDVKYAVGEIVRGWSATHPGGRT